MTRSARELTGLHLHFDCISGIAGDMTLAALFDLGVPVDVVRAVVDKLGLGTDRVSVQSVVKRGVSAVDVRVRLDALEDDDHDDHHHHYSAIRKRIEAAGLEANVVARALDMFDRVARAEAKIHSTTVDAVAFHEVGAVDSIVDIVGTAVAIEWLAPRSVSATSVAMGHGALTCAHGIMPVPAPAALEILREAGGLMTDGGLARELCTPTGAAILAAIVTRWGPMPTMTPVATGYGAGDANLEDRANVVRIIAGRPEGTADASSIHRIEANIDDMSPQLCEHVATVLFGIGALDVWWSPITMKRSRPALQLSALARDEHLDLVVRAILRETTTIGVRFDRVSRVVLDRSHVEVDTAYGRLPIKEASMDGEVVNAAPEYEPCRQAATTHQVALKSVFAAAMAAYHASRSGSDQADL